MATSANKALFLLDGQSAISLATGQENALRIKAGDHFRIVTDPTVSQRSVKAVVKVRGKDLLVACEDGTRITLENYMTECRDGLCDVMLPGAKNPLTWSEVQGADDSGALVLGNIAEPITALDSSAPLTAASAASSDDNFIPIVAGAVLLAAAGGGGGGGGGGAPAAVATVVDAGTGTGGGSQTTEEVAAPTFRSYLSSTTAPSTALTTIAGTAGNSRNETIKLTLTFDGAVNGLTIGTNSTIFSVAGTGVSATWGGIAGGTTRTLTYTVAAGQNGLATIDEAALKTALMAGIRDTAGNAFTYTANAGVIPNIDATALPTIDTSAPVVAPFNIAADFPAVDSMSIFAKDINGNKITVATTLKAGDKIYVEAIVTNNVGDSIYHDGTPFYVIKTNQAGTGTNVEGRRAYIESASGTTNTLLFSYTIVNTDNSLDSVVFMEGIQRIQGNLFDLAGNSLVVPLYAFPTVVETRGINSVLKIDNLPVPLLETVGTGPNSGSVNVSLSERGTFYLVNDSVAVTNLASITGAAADLWNSLAHNTIGVTDARIPVSLSLAGLADGTYSLYAVDQTNNLSKKSTQSYVVAAAASAAAQLVKLVLPQAVDGSLNYYLLDNTGDGVADALNQSDLKTLLASYLTETQADGTKLYTLGGDTYKLASVGHGTDTLLGAHTGTTVGVGSARYAVNAKYDDLLAIWDAHNGELTNQAAMTVADWGSLTGASFWASNTSGGFNYHMNTTGVVGLADTADTFARYAVFAQVVL